MAVRLKRLLSQNRRAVAVLLDESRAALNSPICIQDASGALLLGDEPCDDVERHAIDCAGETIGWVAGGRGSQVLANWLTLLANQVIEMDALADEALNRYREVNLLYNLTGKLTASLDPKDVCSVAIEETRRSIQSSAGGVLLLDKPAGSLTFAAGFGALPGQVPVGEGVIGACAQTNKAEVVNALQQDPRHSQAESAFGALLCTPLETRGNVLGVLLLASESTDVYTAGDLKLLSTLASQSAPIIENALMHERMLLEAKEREERLEQQIQALRIELDESRQAKKVAEITESDYFKRLSQQADDLRRLVEDPG
jgi:transcriptional regulator with GAF, ATPase, and Fis domain